MTRRSRQRGIALLTAMLVVALAGILAVELLWDLNLELRRTERLLSRDQAREIALGAEALAAELLEQDLEDSPEVDSLDEQWAEEYAFPFEGGSVSGRIEDLQGRFNLNSLLRPDGSRDEQAIERFRRLLRAVANTVPGGGANPDNVVDAVLDWMDADQLPELGGAEDDVYTNRQPPYRAANYWFTTPTELLAVDGVTPEFFAALRPLLSALPPDGGESARARRINVNTALPEVLRSLSPDISDTVVEDWVANRKSQPYADISSDFWEGAAQYFPDDANPAEFLDVGSSYYGLSVTVSIGTTRLTMYSLLERSSQGVIPRLRAFDTD